MNWRAEAVKDLKSYPQRKESIENIKERIRILDEQFTSLRGVSTSEPVMGGFSRQEEKMLDKFTILSVAPLFAEAIERIYEDKPVSPMFL